MQKHSLQKSCSLKLPLQLRKAIYALNQEGCAIVVGGAVRDAFLGIANKDFDIELHKIGLKRAISILKQFFKIKKIDKSFLIIKVFEKDFEADFTLARIESFVSKKQNKMQARFRKDISLKEAFDRRDFTINALGFNTKTRRLLDFYGAQEDLARKRIKAVNLNRLDEDPLRVIRALIICSRLNFRIEPQTLKTLRYMSKNKELETLEKRRIFGEFRKLQKAPNLLAFFATFKALWLNNFFRSLQFVDEKTINFYFCKAKGKGTLHILAAFTLGVKNQKYFLYEVGANSYMMFKTFNLLRQLEAVPSIKSKDDFLFFMMNEKNSLDEVVPLISPKKAAQLLDWQKSFGAKKIPKQIVDSDFLLKNDVGDVMNFQIYIKEAFLAQIQGKIRDENSALQWVEENCK